MRLEYLCDMELRYQDLPFGTKKIVMVRPYGGEEGTAYGEGDGTVTGERLRGQVRWVNHPHRRSDGVMLPDAHGLIATGDGAMVMFTLQGRTVFRGEAGGQLLTVTFEAEDERYRWLCDGLCVLEGTISAERLSMQARIYQCVHELFDNP